MEDADNIIFQTVQDLGIEVQVQVQVEAHLGTIITTCDILLSTLILNYIIISIRGIFRNLCRGA